MSEHYADVGHVAKIKASFASDVTPYFFLYDAWDNSYSYCAVIWARSAADASTQIEFITKSHLNSFILAEFRPALVDEVVEWLRFNPNLYAKSADGTMGNVAEILKVPGWQRHHR